jgi:hypothetical protein
MGARSARKGSEASHEDTMADFDRGRARRAITGEAAAPSTLDGHFKVAMGFTTYVLPRGRGRVRHGVRGRPRRRRVETGKACFVRGPAESSLRMRSPRALISRLPSVGLTPRVVVLLRRRVPRSTSRRAIKGGCWFCIDGEKVPARIEAGDVFLRYAQRSFVLASDLTAVPADPTRLSTGNVNKIAKLGDGDAAQLAHPRDVGRGPGAGSA